MEDPTWALTGRRTQPALTGNLHIMYGKCICWQVW